MSRRTLPLFIGVAALWGVPYALISVALDHGAEALWIAWSRVALGALVLLVIAGARGELGGLRGNGLVLAAIGLFDIAVPFSALSLGELHVSSSLASILIATTPLFTGTFAAICVPSERASARGWAGLAIGFAGVVALFGEGLGGEAGSAGLVLLAGASYAVAGLLVKTRLDGVPPLAAGAWALTAAAAILLPAAVLDPPGDADASAWLAIGGLGIPCTAMAFVLYYALIARVGATRASMTTYLSPLFSIAIGALALSEAIEPTAIIGLTLILAGSWLAR